VIDLIVARSWPRDHLEQLEGGKMRSDDLMKPDLLSEVVLALIGTAMFLLLGSVTWIAVLSH